MAKDRVAFVCRDLSGRVPFDLAINNTLESLGDVDIIDIDIFTYSVASVDTEFTCAKIWYRPSSKFKLDDLLMKKGED